ncbi:MAG: biopolymer transporter ExbD [Caulobacterales bacterium]|nr:biopolymer transporter ExbD [Caulobacterales bacterium]
MRKRLSRRDDSGDVNMTPMLDIVFILLIFFIVTATFLQEQGIEMLTPPANNEPEQPQRQVASILVQIDERNTVFVRSKAQSRQVDIARVAANIQREIVENGGRAVVTIQPHPDTEHGTVTAVYDAALQAKAMGVSVRKPAEF